MVTYISFVIENTLIVVTFGDFSPPLHKPKGDDNLLNLMDNFIDSMENKDVFLLVDEEREPTKEYISSGQGLNLVYKQEPNKVLKTYYTMV